jgi:hypothetical protein
MQAVCQNAALDPTWKTAALSGAAVKSSGSGLRRDPASGQYL